MATPLVSTPLVSVVTATYNRPAVLAYAIRSVIAQSLSDWEMLVVGDACTDDTAALVASFADPRLRFHNLAANFGEQSGPNNEGVRMAGGRYLAFLNHDDLWFPDHLALAVAELEATQADGVFAPGAAVRQADRKRLEAGDWQFGWSGRHRNGCYDPATTMGPASTLVLGMDAARRIGPWRPAAECFAESSQDFLFRAWRMGLTIRRGPELSVLMFNSGERKGSYRVDAANEQDFFWGRMTVDAEGLRRDFEARGQPIERRWFSLWPDVALKQCLRGLAHLGLSPRELRFRFKRGLGRGEYIRALRRHRGLDAAAAPGSSAISRRPEPDG
jgi:glycosyltransferase involved in cell wall biosynthesis